MTKYISSIVTKYGDLPNVKNDAKTLRDIIDRQGTDLILDALAEHVGECAIKFKFHSSDTAMTKIALLDALESAINERI